MSLIDLYNECPDEETARQWFETQRWPNGRQCPKCGTPNIQSIIKHKSMTHRCRECPNRPMVSVRKGTVLEDSNLSYQVWAIAKHLFTT